MVTRRRFSDAQRRARLVARHHLARTARDPVQVARSVVALHSTDPLTPYLASWARVPGFATADLDRALYEQRALWRLHAMRRTLFVVPAEDAEIFLTTCASPIARKERRQLEGWLADQFREDSTDAWLRGLERRVLAVLGEQGRPTRELTAAVPELGAQLTIGSGRWATTVSLSSRLLLVLAMEGKIVRAQPAGSWRSSQYRWAAARAWFGRSPEPIDETAGRAELARRYLAAYGPVAVQDLCWWAGWTVKETAAALHAAGAAPVAVASGEAFVAAADAGDPEPTETPIVALLPALDPTAMGWKERGWYTGAHVPRLWDRNGNAGPTVWLNGRVVGGWAQRPDGEVVTRVLEDVGRDAVAAIETEAAALTGWLDGVTVTPRFRTPLERELAVS